MAISTSHIHSPAIKAQASFSPKTSLSAQKLETLCLNQTFGKLCTEWLNFLEMTALRNHAVMKTTQYGEGQLSP